MREITGVTIDHRIDSDLQIEIVADGAAVSCARPEHEVLRVASALDPCSIEPDRDRDAARRSVGAAAVEPEVEPMKLRREEHELASHPGIVAPDLSGEIEGPERESRRTPAIVEIDGGACVVVAVLDRGVGAKSEKSGAV